MNSHRSRPDAMSTNDRLVVFTRPLFHILLSFALVSDLFSSFLARFLFFFYPNTILWSTIRATFHMPTSQDHSESRRRVDDITPVINTPTARDTIDRAIRDAERVSPALECPNGEQSRGTNERRQN